MDQRIRCVCFSNTVSLPGSRHRQHWAVIMVKGVAGRCWVRVEQILQRQSDALVPYPMFQSLHVFDRNPV